MLAPRYFDVSSHETQYGTAKVVVAANRNRGVTICEQLDASQLGRAQLDQRHEVPCMGSCGRTCGACDIGEVLDSMLAGTTSWYVRCTGREQLARRWLVL